MDDFNIEFFDCLMILPQPVAPLEHKDWFKKVSFYTKGDPIFNELVPSLENRGCIISKYKIQ